jgi:hypothetical protein
MEISQKGRLLPFLSFQVFEDPRYIQDPRRQGEREIVRNVHERPCIYHSRQQEEASDYQDCAVGRDRGAIGRLERDVGEGRHDETMDQILLLQLLICAAAMVRGAGMAVLMVPGAQEAEALGGEGVEGAGVVEGEAQGGDAGVEAAELGTGAALAADVLDAGAMAAAAENPGAGDALHARHSRRPSSPLFFSLLRSSSLFFFSVLLLLLLLLLLLRLRLLLRLLRLLRLLCSSSSSSSSSSVLKRRAFCKREGGRRFESHQSHFFLPTFTLRRIVAKKD